MVEPRIASGPMQTLRNDYSTTNVLNSAFTTLIASTNAQCISIEIVETSGIDLVLGIGPAGSEVTLLNIPGNENKIMPLHISKGSRVSAKAVGAANISGGVLILNLFY